MPAPSQEAGAPVTRSPAVMATRLAAAGFAIMMAVELAIYGKGVGRAVLVSVISAAVIFAIVFFAVRSRARSGPTG